MNSRETVCAVVVTYNRKELLIKCLEALRKQTRPLEGIYIIDNASIDGTPELLKEKGYIKELPPTDLTKPWEKEFEVKNLVDGNTIKIHYVRMHENTGGAGGFHEGVKRAYTKGYDWLWLMDDDGLPTKNCLNCLFKWRYKFDFIAPLVIDKENSNKLAFGIEDIKTGKLLKNVEDIKEDYYLNTANPFNGILISKKVIEKLGPPKKNFFIWGDEIEFLLRCQKYNFKVATITKCIFLHPTSKLEYISLIPFLKKGKLVYTKNKLRNYCYIRNHTHIYKIYNKKLLFKFLLKYFLAFLLGKLTVRDFNLFLEAAYDGIKGNWGKEKNIGM